MEENLRLAYHTASGKGWVEVSALGVCRVALPSEQPFPTPCAPGRAVPRHGNEAVDQLQQYFAGKLQRFDLPLDLGRLTAFQERILRQAALILYGTVISYRQLAELAGYPRAARAAGGVMATNRLPIIIPCHRVVASSGALTGYSGAGGLITKRFLLRMEGVEFKGEKICRIFDRYEQQK